MPHYLFNFSDGDRQHAAVLLRANMWGVGRDERYGDALAPGDLALIYLPAPEAEFIGRAELATAVHDWTPAEADAYPGDSTSGVLLSHVEEWHPAVPMNTVVRRVDPTAFEPARPGERHRRLPNARRPDYRCRIRERPRSEPRGSGDIADGSQASVTNAPPQIA